MNAPERVRFFSGQVLGAADFGAEQAYHLQMRRLHNQLLHGAGVVQGLNVSPDAPGVVVAPGIALDGLGREIIVPTASHLALGAYAKDACFVTLRYMETATTPVPTTNGHSDFSRVKEGFLLGTAEEDPRQNGGSEMLGIAKLTRKAGLWTVDVSYKPLKPRGAV